MVSSFNVAWRRISLLATTGVAFRQARGDIGGSLIFGSEDGLDLLDSGRWGVRIENRNSNQNNRIIPTEKHHVREN